MTAIGLFGSAKDVHVRALSSALQREGASTVVVDFHGYPRLHTLSWDAELPFDDMRAPAPLSLSSLAAVHLRPAAFESMPEHDAASVDASAIARHHARQIARLSVQLSVARRLSRSVPVVNPADSFRYHRQKAFQHTLLVRHGIATPRTLVTHRADLARRFSRELGGRVVAKPLASGAEVVMADDALLDRMEAAPSPRPTLFQQLVRGASYRAYVLGGRIVSMGQLHYDTRYVDWRERTRGVTRVSPSAGIAAAAARAVRLLDLPSCGLDIEHDDATGEDYFLDFNPAAMFVVWSKRIGDDIAGEMARYLIDAARSGSASWAW